MVGSRFQSLGAAQLNDLSARVFLVLIVGKANKVAESSLRLKLGNLSTRRFLRADGNRNSNLLPIHVSRRHGQPSRLGADFVLLILTSLVKREFRLYDFRSFISFCPQFFVLIDA